MHGHSHTRTFGFDPGTLVPCADLAQDDIVCNIMFWRLLYAGRFPRAIAVILATLVAVVPRCALAAPRPSQRQIASPPWRPY